MATPIRLPWRAIARSTSNCPALQPQRMQAPTARRWASNFSRDGKGKAEPIRSSEASTGVDGPLPGSESKPSAPAVESNPILKAVKEPLLKTSPRVVPKGSRSEQQRGQAERQLAAKAKSPEKDSNNIAEGKRPLAQAVEEPFEADLFSALAGAGLSEIKRLPAMKHVREDQREGRTKKVRYAKPLTANQQAFAFLRHEKHRGALALPLDGTEASPYNESNSSPQSLANMSNRPEGPEDEIRLPRAVQATYLRPLRRTAEFGVPTCDLQLRSYNAQNLEFFTDFVLRAAYYCKLPAYGPIPLPRIVERWTVPKGHFVHKKSQENFERKTMRRMIQIRDGDAESVRIWLAFIRKHAYYGIGMKANIWEFSSLDVGKAMDEQIKAASDELDSELDNFAFRKGSEIKDKVVEFMDQENRRIAVGGSSPMQQRSRNPEPGF